MITQAMLDKIAQYPSSASDVPEELPTEIIAFFVSFVRHQRQWKVATLADFAQVSVSTIERIERGERVRGASLDRVACALGYPEGYLTTARPRGSLADAAEELHDIFNELEIVHVHRLNMHCHVRDIINCHAYLVNRPNISNIHDYEISLLIELLDYGAFITSPMSLDMRTPKQGRRELYTAIIERAKSIERNGMTVLSGVLAHPQPGIPQWRVAVISITNKATDPAAAKRSQLLVDRRLISLNGLDTGSIDLSDFGA